MSEKKNLVRNTTDEARTAPGAATFLLDAMGKGTSEAIEDMEKRGQMEQVWSDVLPTEGTTNDEERAQWRAMGVVLGEEVAGDPLFRQVQFPTGWKKVASDHSMHSSLVDEQGRERASIFYKAAFYDRRAFIHLTPRYQVREESVTEGDYNGPRYAVVLDGGKEIHRTAIFPAARAPGPGEHAAWVEYDKQRNAARSAGYDWLAAHFPNYKDPTAYWELP